MANLIKRGDSWSLQLMSKIDGKEGRRTIGLGKVPKRAAEAVKLRVEFLVSAHLTGTAPDDDTSRWIAGLPDSMHAKLAAVGLVSPRRSDPAESLTIGEWVRAYIAGRTDHKYYTRVNCDMAARSMYAFFGNDRSIRSVTKEDAKAYLRWLLEKGSMEGGPLGKATVGRRFKRARQFFQAAVDAEKLDRNPFVGKDIKVPSGVNRTRSAFVDRRTVDRVLAACPNHEWKVIVALCRFGGLRCPSEIVPLTWAHVDFDRGRIEVLSPKTERHAGGESRTVPLFPELRAILETAKAAAGPDARFVVPTYRDARRNPRTQFTRILRRAGVAPWPRLFHNLRASRQTELEDAGFPSHVVCKWLGNSPAIAEKHYLQATDEHFARATAGTGAANALHGAANALQNTAAPTRTEKTSASGREAINLGNTGVFMNLSESDRTEAIASEREKVPLRRLELRS